MVVVAVILLDAAVDAKGGKASAIFGKELAAQSGKLIKLPSIDDADGGGTVDARLVVVHVEICLAEFLYGRSPAH